MIIAAEFSFNKGKESIIERYSNILDEVKEIILNMELWHKPLLSFE
jgi:hypothetical protein